MDSRSCYRNGRLCLNLWNHILASTPCLTESYSTFAAEAAPMVAVCRDDALSEPSASVIVVISVGVNFDRSQELEKIESGEAENDRRANFYMWVERRE
jgi:hypothetical protein